MIQQPILLSHYFQITANKIALDEANFSKNALVWRKKCSITPRRRFSSIVVVSREVIEAAESGGYNELKVALFATGTLDQRRVAGDVVFGLNGDGFRPCETVITPGKIQFFFGNGDYFKVFAVVALDQAYATDSTEVLCEISADAPWARRRAVVFVGEVREPAAC